ncbi:hypothetical protein E4U59_002295 [Claviceps monticola]|nr:hypothetical protein E4U59_002295 [Claviceps monticola]
MPDPILIVPVLDGDLTPAIQVTGDLSPLQTLSGDPVKNGVTFLPSDLCVVEMRIEDLVPALTTLFWGSRANNCGYFNPGLSTFAFDPRLCT